MSIPESSDQDPAKGADFILRRTLSDLERVTALLRRKVHAAEDEGRRASGLATLFRDLRAAGVEALALERSGIAPGLAVARVARRHGSPEATVAYWRDAARRGQSKGARALRDREVIRLAALGHTNGAIGARIGISSRTVSRIVTAAYRTPP
ncbi:MAG: hypothetical protein GC186_16550 [Rhodobacteraceae bacterium]|nr:hypothetical protein [Paracoccaceae bacterium]